MEIPVELIEEIERGNCVLFLGWSFPKPNNEISATALSEQVLAQRLADRIKYSRASASLDEIAQYFELERGRNELIRFVCEVIEEFSHQIPEYYRKIAKLPFNIIVSTTLDNNLKTILREQG